MIDGTNITRQVFVLSFRNTAVLDAGLNIPDRGTPGQASGMTDRFRED